MYTRSYFQENAGAIPKNYDGNAFKQDDGPILVTPTYGEAKISPEYTSESSDIDYSDQTCNDEAEENEAEGVFSRLMSKIPFKKLPFGLGEMMRCDGGGIDLEDIIIIAVALLLFFSCEGDKLLSVALLALLLVR